MVFCCNPIEFSATRQTIFLPKNQFKNFSAWNRWAHLKVYRPLTCSSRAFIWCGTSALWAQWRHLGGDGGPLPPSRHIGFAPPLLEIIKLFLGIFDKKTWDFYQISEDSSWIGVFIKKYPKISIFLHFFKHFLKNWVNFNIFCRY